MIYASTVYTQLLAKIRKDVRGRSLSIDEFNLIIPQVNLSLFEDFYKEFEKNIESSDTLAKFKVFDAQVVVTPDTNNLAAVGLLPSNYYHIIGKPRRYATAGTVRIDVVSTYENAEREDDYLTQPTTTHPTCMIGGVDTSSSPIEYKKIRVYPYNIGSPIYIDYLKVPQTPFLDYYVSDTLLTYTYLDEGATVSVPLGYTYRDGTAGGAAVSVASYTRDLDWDDEDMDLIMAKLMSIVGVQLPDEVLVQASVMNEAKITGK
jgi:hypothetical protein